MEFFDFLLGQSSAQANSSSNLNINLISKVDPEQAYQNNDVYNAPALDAAFGAFGELLDGKQEDLVSGENIKTINNQSILGSGNINIDTSNDSNNTTLNITQVEHILPAASTDVGKIIQYIGEEPQEVSPMLITPVEFPQNTIPNIGTLICNQGDLAIGAVAYSASSATPVEVTSETQGKYYIKTDYNSAYLEVTLPDEYEEGITYYTINYDIPNYYWKLIQSQLASGENIKTINSQSLLGEGDITIEGNAKIPELKTINGVSLLGSGNIVIEGVETDGVSSDVSNLRGELKEALGETSHNEDITNTLTITNGFYAKDTGVFTKNENAQASNIFAVKQGEKYFITGAYGYYASLIVAFDESNTYLPDKSVFSNESANTSVDDYEYIIPEGVAYIGCSTRQTIAASSTTGRDLIVKKEIVEYNNILDIIEETKNNIEEKHNEDIIQLDEKLTLTVKNICPNSNFEGTPTTDITEKLNWMANTADSALKFENNTAIFTANGSANRSRMKMNIGSEFFKEHIYYIQASIKSSSKTEYEYLTFYTSNNDVPHSSLDIIKEKPRLKNSIGLFNDYYGNFDFTSSDFSTEGIQLWVSSSYSLPTDALNQSTQVKNFFICDLTESFGAGKEPTASQFYNILQAGGKWFKDSRQVPVIDLIKPTLPIVSDYLITVGENGDCQTINDALEQASKVYPVYKKRGIKIEIRILDGTIIDEQILVESLDLSYISITTDNPDNKVIVTPTPNNWSKGTVSHDSRGNMPFFAGEFGARLPMIKCLFSCTSPTLYIDEKDIGIVGYYCNRGSMGTIVVGSAYEENKVNSGAPEIEAEVGFEGFYDCIIANNNSEITLRECIARNAGRYGIMSRHISRISARSADLTNCGTIVKDKITNGETVTVTEQETTAAAYADRSSIMDVRFANVSDSYNGIQAFNTSNITAVETIANNITNTVADSRSGSIINCDLMTIDNSKDVFKVNKGSTIIATGNTPTNITGVLYNIETNTINANGIIYDN